MGRLGGGTCNSSFNGRSHSFHKSRRIKARLVKQAVGAKDKHLAELAARKDTKKVQKRRARDQRLREKEQELIETSMDVDGRVNTKNSTDEKLGLALKRVGAGKKRYQKFLGKKVVKTEANKKTKKETGRTATIDKMEE